MEGIRTYGIGNPKFRNLSKAANIMSARSNNGVKYEVDNTYFIIDQDWVWTTIIAKRSENFHWQALSPAQQEKIVSAETSEELEEAVKEVMDECEQKYSPLYSFRKTKRIWNINVTQEITTSFTVEAETADEANEIFEQWVYSHGDEINDRIAEEYHNYEFSYPTALPDEMEADITKGDI